jgi:DNA-binding GntR family transcriptional regulator
MKNRASDLAFNTLRDWIVRGDFPATEPLENDNLQSRLGVGRTPLREALQRLEQAGLVRVIPNRGTFINNMTFPELLLLMEARMELEAVCAKMVASKPNPEILSQLEQMLLNPTAFIPPNDNRDPVFAMDELFHPMMYAATGNPYFEDTLLRFYYIATVSSNALGIPRFSIHQIQDDWNQLLRAIRARDPETAALVMRRHVGSFRDRVVEQLMGSGSQVNAPLMRRTELQVETDYALEKK